MSEKGDSQEKSTDSKPEKSTDSKSASNNFADERTQARKLVQGLPKHSFSGYP